MVTVEELVLATTALVAIGALAVSATQGRFSVRRDQRKAVLEERAQDNADDAAAITVATVTIALLEKNVVLLEKQNTEIAKQGDRREEEWRKREDEWHRRECNLEERVSAIDNAYKELVKQIQSMSQCAKAAHCLEYDPGDRRVHVLATGAEGTD
jgi:predicted  nucleic acid-binding Zn-ribbon protein